MGAGSARCAPPPAPLGVTHSMVAGFLGQVFQTGNRSSQRLKTDTASLLPSPVGQADTEPARVQGEEKETSSQWVV